MTAQAMNTTTGKKAGKRAVGHGLPVSLGNPDSVENRSQLESIENHSQLECIENHSQLESIENHLHLTLTPLGVARRGQLGLPEPGKSRVAPTSISAEPEAWEEMLELFGSGCTIQQVAAHYGLFQSRALWQYINNDATRRAAYKAARADYGAAQAARADETANQVAAGEMRPDAAKVVIDQARWSAARADPHTWGEQQRVSIEGDLHVHQANDADLRDQLSGIVSALAARTGTVVQDVSDAEVVDDAAYFDGRILRLTHLLKPRRYWAFNTHRVPSHHPTHHRLSPSWKN